MTRSVIVGAVALLLVVISVVGLIVADILSLGDESTEADTGNDAVALGQSIYEQQCSGCHAIDDSNSVGPSFRGLYGSEVTMEDGTAVVVDDEHIVESVTQPRAKVRESYPAVMPSFNDLSEDELAAIVAFIESLE